MAEAVKVIVRCRPLNGREISLKSEIVLHMDPTIVQVRLEKPKASAGHAKQFTFDGVYYINDNTLQIYEEICFPVVSGVLDGYNGTVFAYGQTGCGKSYTMMGVEDPPEKNGVIPRAFRHIFDQIAVNTSVKYLVRASYLEIYNEEVRDLLAKDSKHKLDLHEHPEKGVYVKNLSMHKVQNIKDLQVVMDLGNSNRSVGATLMNVDSSRSHSIFTIDIEMMEYIGGESKLKAGRLNLVDLAGSERQSKTHATGDRFKEATKINLSLSALGNVISSLVDGKSKHIPYRDSKLTRLLQSSLGGNTKTLMVACISPADNNYEETLSTLRYANRAKNIKNKPKINEDPKDAMLREYQDEINKLKMMLEGKDIPTMATAPAEPVSVAIPDQLKWEAEKEEIKRMYEEKIDKLRDKFGKEKANKDELQMELSKLQEDRNQQFSLLEKEKATINQQEQQQQQQQQQKSGAKADRQLESTGKAAEPTKGKKDKSVTKNKEDAQKRLEALQGEMIGGEKASDKKLKKAMERRQKAAADHQQQLLRVGMENEDDFVIERIFNSLTDEVRVKTKSLERYREKLLTTEDDIKDMSQEFEMERQDYLDTIRRQDQTVQLFEQLLTTVVPLLRRDCNYFNMDKIKMECKWDRNAAQWIIPKLVTNTTVLTHAELPKAPGGGNQVSVNRSKGGSSGVPTSKETVPEDKYLSYLQNANDSNEYFKPKRALEILGKSQFVSKESSTGHVNKTIGSTSSSSLNTSFPNAAAVHGVDATNVGSMHPGKKLQSLTKNIQPLTNNPQVFKPLQEKNLEDLDTKKKKNSLKPLTDAKLRKLSK